MEKTEFLEMKEKDRERFDKKIINAYYDFESFCASININAFEIRNRNNYSTCFFLVWAMELFDYTNEHVFWAGKLIHAIIDMGKNKCDYVDTRAILNAPIHIQYALLNFSQALTQARRQDITVELIAFKRAIQITKDPHSEQAKEMKTFVELNKDYIR